jgi:hypothetical protein
MKSRRHDKDLGTAVDCTIGLVEACVSSKGIRCAAWFGSILTVSELSLHGFEAVMQVKQNHGFYPKKRCSWWVHTVL